jgi:hypothetical protein
MKVVTREDMIEFIQQQPDDRQVRFGENLAGDTCGCIMVQYARYAGIKFSSCGYCGWWRGGACKAELEYGTMFSVFWPGLSNCTYRDIKQHLKEKGWM